MKHYFISKQIISLFLALLLSACVNPTLSLNGDFGTSENGPRLGGQIQAGRYQAKVGYFGPTFTVNIPQARDDYEYSHMWRSDERRLYETRAVFGPAALDGTIYRVWVSKKESNFADFEAKKLTEALLEAKRANGFDLKAGVKKAMTLNGRTVHFHFYEQEILDTTHELLPYYNKGIYSHAFYFIDADHYAALLWIQATTGGGVNAIDKLGQKSMINGSFEPQKYFVNSFKLEE